MRSVVASMPFVTRLQHQHRSRGSARRGRYRPSSARHGIAITANASSATLFVGAR